MAEKIDFSSECALNCLNITSEIMTRGLCDILAKDRDELRKCINDYVAKIDSVLEYLDSKFSPALKNDSDKLTEYAGIMKYVLRNVAKLKKIVADKNSMIVTAIPSMAYVEGEVKRLGLVMTVSCID